MEYLLINIPHLELKVGFFELPASKRLLGLCVIGFWITYFDQLIIQFIDDLYILCFFFFLLCGLLLMENEDCCVHCILACLFCEFLTLCNIVLGQASCGICTSEACCCCCGDEMGDDCNCPCDMDCGIMDACCESSDCLEICMECCGICFPS